MPAKIVTYSMDEYTLKRLDKLTDWMNIPNKSNILRILIDKEYRAQMELREDLDET